MAAGIGEQGRSIWLSARDGLKLHVRCYDAPSSRRTPVLCLAGLTRNSRDFHDLAAALSSGSEARTVYALDCRGRGLSDHDRDWKNYAILVEMHDVIDVATALGLHDAAIVGTSRGGLIAMVLAAAQPGIAGSVVLNDIGPVIERDGLMRIAGYVGRVPLPATWREATAVVAEMSKRQFTDVPAGEWEDVARAWFNEKDGRPAPGFDPAIGKAVAAAGTVIPELWPQFAALGQIPLFIVRGANSDILSAATLSAMIERHTNAVALTVQGQGHAPLLKDQPTIGAIARFISTAESRAPRRGRDLSTA